MDATTELVAIDAAILAVYGGAQSYSINGRTVMRANLKDLLARKQQLEFQIDRQQNGLFRVSSFRPEE